MSGAKRTALIAGAALLLGLSGYHFVFSAWNNVSRGIADFPIFARHAEQFHETGELYLHADNLAAYAPGTVVYKFPPTYAMFLLPLVRHGIPETFYYYHWGFLLLVYLGAAALAVHVVHPARPGPFLFCASLLALNLEPFFETLWRQQLEIPLLLLLTAGMWAFAARRDLVAGSAVGLGAMLKVYPASLLFFFAVRRRWKIVAACLGAAILIQCASLLVIGLEQNRIYFFHILPAMLSETSKVAPENLALGRYVQEWFGLAPLASKRVSQGIVLGLLALFFYVTRRGPGERQGGERPALEFALFVALILLWMPNSWISYQTLLLPLYLALLREALEARRGRTALFAALLAGYGCLLFFMPCAGPEMSWPCAETPRFLGLFQLPRGLHDAMTGLRPLGTLLPVGAAFGLLLAARRAGSGTASGDA